MSSQVGDHTGTSEIVNLLSPVAEKNDVILPNDVVQARLNFYESPGELLPGSGRRVFGKCPTEEYGSFDPSNRYGGDKMLSCGRLAKGAYCMPR